MNTDGTTFRWRNGRIDSTVIEEVCVCPFHSYLLKICVIARGILVKVVNACLNGFDSSQFSHLSFFLFPQSL